MGCTLFKLLTGRAPFADEQHITAFAKMTAHVSKPAPPLNDFLPDAPRGLVDLLDTMLAKEPDDRPLSPKHVIDALAPFCADHNLPQLIHDAAQLSPQPQPSAVATGAASRSLAKSWRMRKIPLFYAVAAGLSGMLMGLLMSIVIVITNPDGTRSFLQLAEGSKVQIGDEQLLPAKSVQMDAAQPDPAEFMEGMMDKPSMQSKPSMVSEAAAVLERMQGIWEITSINDSGFLEKGSPNSGALFVHGNRATFYRRSELTSDGTLFLTGTGRCTLSASDHVLLGSCRFSEENALEFSFDGFQFQSNAKKPVPSILRSRQPSFLIVGMRRKSLEASEPEWTAAYARWRDQIEAQSAAECNNVLLQNAAESVVNPQQSSVGPAPISRPGEKAATQLPDNFLRSTMTTLFAVGQPEQLRKDRLQSAVGETPQAAFRNKFNEVIEELGYPKSIRSITQTVPRKHLWLTVDSSSAYQITIDKQHLFSDIEIVVDTLAGTKGIFREVLDGLKRDPNGPHLDLEDLAQSLGDEVVVVVPKDHQDSLVIAFPASEKIKLAWYQATGRGQGIAGEEVWREYAASFYGNKDRSAATIVACLHHGYLIFGPYATLTRPCPPNKGVVRSPSIRSVSGRVSGFVTLWKRGVARTCSAKSPNYQHELPASVRPESKPAWPPQGGTTNG